MERSSPLPSTNTVPLPRFPTSSSCLYHQLLVAFTETNASFRSSGSLLELRGLPPTNGHNGGTNGHCNGSKERERRKFVSFTVRIFTSSLRIRYKNPDQVELDRTGGPIGITLATDEGEGKTKSSKVGPIVISRFIILIHNPKLPIF